MAEYCSKITECYIKMTYSKHKMTEYRCDGGLGAAVRGVGGWSTRGRCIGRCGMKVRHAGAHGHMGRWGTHGHRVRGARMVNGARGWLDRSVGWLV
jgi:hypothetical protein